MKNFIKTVVSLFKKVNSFKEIFGFVQVLGDVLEYASKRFAEYEEKID